jgi:hypothetical protein
MKKNVDWKLRVVLLTSVSGLVLLGGCDSYRSFRQNVFGERPEQQVEGVGRRMPVMNPQGMQTAPLAPQTTYRMPPQPMYSAPAQQAAPHIVPPPVTTAPRTGKLVTADDAHFVSNNNMNPPATGANEKPENSNLIARMMGKDTPHGHASRKPIEGNSYPDRQTQMVAPVPEGPLLDDAPVSNVMKNPNDSAQRPVAVPLYQENAGSAAPEHPPLSDPLPERPLIAPQMAQPVLQAPAAPAEPEPLRAAPLAVAPAMPAPQGDIPLVEAMPLDPDEAKIAPAVVPAQPLAPQVQQQPEPEAPRQPVQIAAMQPQEAVPAVIPQAPADTRAVVPRRDADEEMFIPVTDFKTEEDAQTVTISSLADKRKQPQEDKASSWMDEVFGGSDEKETTGGDRTWVERQLGFEDAKPEVQKQPYPSFSSVPEKPEQFERAQAAGRQDVQELQSMRDQARESQVMLEDEPSVMDMATGEDVISQASQPIAGSAAEPQLLGHISAPPELNVVADDAVSSVRKESMAQAAAPAQQAMESIPAAVPVAPAAQADAMTPLVAPMNMDDVPQPPVPVAAPVLNTQMQADAAVAQAQQAVDEAVANAPVAANEGGVVFPDAIKARQDAEAQMQQDRPVSVPEAAAAQAPAAEMSPALPSPELLNRVQVLPPSRYESRRVQQAQ